MQLYCVSSSHCNILWRMMFSSFYSFASNGLAVVFSNWGVTKQPRNVASTLQPILRFHLYHSLSSLSWSLFMDLRVAKSGNVMWPRNKSVPTFCKKNIACHLKSYFKSLFFPPLVQKWTLSPQVYYPSAVSIGAIWGLMETCPFPPL